MSCTTESEKFWLENFKELFRKPYILPTRNMNDGAKLNAVTRLIVLIFLLMLLFNYDQSVIFLILGISIIVIVYFVQNKTNKENYGKLRQNMLISNIPVTYGKPFEKITATPLPKNDPYFDMPKMTYQQAQMLKPVLDRVDAYETNVNYVPTSFINQKEVNADIPFFAPIQSTNPLVEQKPIIYQPPVSEIWRDPVKSDNIVNNIPYSDNIEEGEREYDLDTKPVTLYNSFFTNVNDETACTGLTRQSMNIKQSPLSAAFHHTIVDSSDNKKHISRHEHVERYSPITFNGNKNNGNNKNNINSNSNMNKSNRNNKSNKNNGNNKTVEGYGPTIFGGNGDQPKNFGGFGPGSGGSGTRGGGSSGGGGYNPSSDGSPINVADDLLYINTANYVRMDNSDLSYFKNPAYEVESTPSEDLREGCTPLNEILLDPTSEAFITSLGPGTNYYDPNPIPINANLGISYVWNDDNDLPSNVTYLGYQNGTKHLYARTDPALLRDDGNPENNADKAVQKRSYWSEKYGNLEARGSLDWNRTEEPPNGSNTGNIYANYNGIDKGNINYYSQDVPPFVQPLFISRNKVDVVEYTDPMGKTVPDWHFHTGLNGVKEQVGNRWLEDTTVHREDMMASQMQKRNREIWQRRVAQIYTDGNNGSGRIYNGY